MLTCITHHSYGLPSAYPLRQFARQPAEFGGRMPRPWNDYNRYLNTVEYADQFMGQIIDGLKERGQLDDTLIVVVGDHGQGFYEHGQKAHNTVIWDEGLHVPLVVSNPKLFKEPRVIDGVRRQVDIAPTILSGVGVHYPPDFFEGHDLATGAPHQRAYSSCWYNQRCMAETSGSVRVIDNFDHQPMEVYDLAADPFERQNLLLTGTPEERAKWQTEATAARERMRTYVTTVDERYTHADGGDNRDFVLSVEPKPTYPVQRAARRLDRAARLRHAHARGRARRLLGRDRVLQVPEAGEHRLAPVRRARDGGRPNTSRSTTIRPTAASTCTSASPARSSPTTCACGSRATSRRARCATGGARCCSRSSATSAGQQAHRAARHHADAARRAGARPGAVAVEADGQAAVPPRSGRAAADVDHEAEAQDRTIRSTCASATT